MENNNIKWCRYCKDEILEDEEYFVKRKKLYHIDCWKQLNTYYDEFGNTNGK